MDDHQLLREFAASRSETAFRTLLSRHLDLVHSVALRQVAGDATLAQDVSQAVFILLARKAERLPAGTILAGWLYRTTRFVAGRAQRAKVRRERREQEVLPMQEPASSDPDWKRVAPLLDEALAKLKDAERDAILLRYFEEQPLLKVGQALGVSEAAAGKRITRALESLRAHFGRRGFTITAAALAAALAHISVKAAPGHLAPAIANSVFAHAPAAATAHALLVRETLQAWRWLQWRWIAGASLVLATAALLALAAAHRPPARSATAPAERPLATPALAAVPPAPEPVAAAPATAPGAVDHTNFLHFQAVDGVTGKAVVAARVLAVIATDPSHIERFTNLITDAQGCCLVPRSDSDAAMLAVGVVANGYTERCVVGGGPFVLPDHYVLKLTRGSTIGGIIQDNTGAPVAGASVQVTFYGTGDHSDREFQQERPGFPDDTDMTVVTTDSQGRWSFGSAPENGEGFYLEAKHPAYPAMSFYNESDGRNFAGKAGRFKAEELLKATSVFVLADGLGMHGFVVDEQQHPVVGAQVSCGPFANANNPSTRTAADGSFTLKPLTAGEGTILVTAAGLAPERQTVTVAENAPSLTISLKPAARLRLRLIDESGAAVDHVDVRLQAWRGYNTLDWGGFTGSDGRIEWDSAPHDELNVYAGKSGYFSSRNNLLVADGEEHAITLHPQVTVSGRVTDAGTGLPLARFKAVPGTERMMLVNGTNGEYTLTFQEFHQPLEIHFEADGYATGSSGPLSPQITNQVCDVRLPPQKASEIVQGVVLLPEGGPAAGAEVGLATAQKPIRLGDGRFLDRDSSTLTKTDAAGHFRFPDSQAAVAVVALHNRGFAEYRLDAEHRPTTLPLQPWGRIEGVLKLRRQDSGSRQINLTIPASPYGHPSFALDRTANTDAQGNFRFEKVPPGALSLYLSPGLYRPWSHQTSAQIAPGQTTQVQIGGTGSTVKGQFISSAISHPIDWSKQVRHPVVVTPNPVPPAPPELRGDDRRKWFEAYYSSDEGLAALRAARSYPVTVEADGKFSVDDIPPGKYELMATLLSTPLDVRQMVESHGAPALASVHRTIIVPEPADGASWEDVDLGSVAMEARLSGSHF